MVLDSVVIISQIYWYVPLFAIALCIYPIYNNAEITEKDGTFNPPPNYLLPKKYRLFFHYAILVLDILILPNSSTGGNIVWKQKHI